MGRLIEISQYKLNCNPFKQSVGEQLAALRKQNELGGWRIREADFYRLAKTAPTWPVGRDAFRSFTIRLGNGSDGVAQTFEAHAAAIKRVYENRAHPNFVCRFGEGSEGMPSAVKPHFVAIGRALRRAKYGRWELLHSKPMPYQGELTERLRLRNGNESHHAKVDWCIIPDLSAFRRRVDVSSVCAPKSLADEGLVLAWLNPDRIHAIDHKKRCSWYCGGYEVNVPELEDGEWQLSVVIRCDIDSSQVCLDAGWQSNNDPACSVPSFR